MKILKDSLAPCGKRLTTWELTYSRFVHSELMSHRIFSRNAASSRAIPIKKVIEKIKNDTSLPLFWGKNQAGMQAYEELDSVSIEKAKSVILKLRDITIDAVEVLEEIGLHKQISNRYLEPFQYITTILTGTEFDNWFKLRDHKDAQPEIAWAAGEMHKQYKDHKPTELQAGVWHLPLLDDETWDEICKRVERRISRVELAKKVSVGRCCRVSYLSHDGKRDLQKDVELHDKLISGLKTGEPPHLSPFEHVAMALDKAERIGNFIGWKQYRKFIVDSEVE